MSLLTGSNCRKRAGALFTAAAAVVGTTHAAHAAMLPGVVFNDTLATNGSTLNSSASSYPNAAAPTSTSTNYDIVSSKDASTSTLTSGSPLQMKMASTSSGLNEAQAVFTSTPVQLVNPGDSIVLTATFTPVAGINTSGSSAVYLGLYSSGGNAPYSNAYNGSNGNAVPPATNMPGITGLNNTFVNDNAGGVQNYVGYEAYYFAAQSTKLFNRPAQATSTNNVDQSLGGSGQTGGYTTIGTAVSYVGQNSTETALTQGNTYTDEETITLNSSGLYVITDALYNGSTDTGTQVGTTTTSMGQNPLSGGAGFDAFTVGYRESASGATSELDVNSVEITTNTVPEPASLSILVLGGVSVLARRRKMD